MFLVASGDLPKIKHRGLASKRCLSFVEVCTSQEDDRPQAKDLLSHPFLGLACDTAGMAQLLTRTYELEAGATNDGVDDGDGNDEEGEDDTEEGGMNGATLITPVMPFPDDTKTQEPVPALSSQLSARPMTPEAQVSSFSEGSTPPSSSTESPLANSSPSSFRSGQTHDERPQRDSNSTTNSKYSGSAGPQRPKDLSTEDLADTVVVVATKVTTRPTIGRSYSPTQVPTTV